MTNTPDRKSGRAQARIKTRKSALKETRPSLGDGAGKNLKHRDLPSPGLFADLEGPAFPEIAAVSRLLRTGKLYEAAAMAEETARNAVDAGQNGFALELLSRTVRIVVGRPGDALWDTLLLSVVIELCRLKITLVQELEEIPQLLQQARPVAERLGDLRTLARIDLIAGLQHYVFGRTAEGLRIISSGLSQADALGDSDILAISAEFRGVYYYLQGRYKEAVDSFDMVVRSLNMPSGRPIRPFLPEHLASSSSALGYCCALLGQYHRAVGVLDSHWRRSRMRKDDRNSCFYEALMGIVLIIMGRRAEAHGHLLAAQKEALAFSNKPALHVVRKGLSYYHFFEGNLDDAYRIAAETVYTVAIGPQYNWPVMLEMLDAFDRAGYPPLSALDLEEELESIIRGPNLHLRGVALRIRALRDRARGENGEMVLSLLEASEADLLRSGDPIELAKTRAEMARIRLDRGERDTARHLALMAWEGLSGYGRDYFPDALVELLEMGLPYRSGSSWQDRLDRFIDLIDEYTPGTDRDEHLTRIVAATSEFFGAERGGLFLFSDKVHAPRPTLRAAYNLNQADVANASFHGALSLIFKAFRSAEPLIITDTSPRGEIRGSRQAKAVFCLPISVKGAVRAVLYLDNFYTHEESDNADRAMVLRVSRHLGVTMERIIRYTEMLERSSSQHALAQTAGQSDHPDRLILGRSPLMLALIERADQAAATDANVLITGETGVGKELLARRIHEKSTRKNGPFAVVDLSSIPESLAESELFGHEKGAFTGADRQRRGRVELADKGTLFIDEIGDIPLNSQVKLLRVLQDKSFIRIGGTKIISSDFRLVAATNRNLPREVAAGRFRQDLFYRINVLHLALPGLRERGDDIVLLAQEFLEMYARKYRRAMPPLGHDDMAALKAYSWPGNVRELRNIMERCAILSSPEHLDLNLPAAQGTSLEPSFADQPTMDEIQRRYIEHVLTMTGGRIAGPGGAAEVLGMKRTTLQARMKKLKITPSQ